MTTKRDKNGGKSPLQLLKSLSPQQLAVIVGLLTQSLSVDSLLVDKDQNIEIVLGGSLRKKTKTDRLLTELSEVSVGDLLEAIKNM
jgi:hypothetical protein